jgi:Rhodopirellula transposase DDE domain
VGADTGQNVGAALTANDVDDYAQVDCPLTYGWAFAVETIRRWWYKLGKARYPDATCLTITADCGGSYGPQMKLWKCELQRLAAASASVTTNMHGNMGRGKGPTSRGMARAAGSAPGSGASENVQTQYALHSNAGGSTGPPSWPLLPLAETWANCPSLSPV